MKQQITQVGKTNTGVSIGSDAMQVDYFSFQVVLLFDVDSLILSILMLMEILFHTNKIRKSMEETPI